MKSVPGGENPAGEATLDVRLYTVGVIPTRGNKRCLQLVP